MVRERRCAARAASAPSEPEREPRETRRPRHTKPRQKATGPRVKLFIGAGRREGVEPADVVGAIVDHSHLEGEQITRVRVLDRFSFAEVPADRAAEVVDKVSGADLRGTKIRLEVAKK